MNTFTYLHSSGRFDRSIASVQGDLAVWEGDGKVTLETFTEFSSNPRRRALIDEGWALFNGKELPGADDCVIRWRTDTWKLLKTDTAVVSTVKTWRTNGKPIPPQYVTTILLEHLPTGETVLVSISHLPSHVEVAGGLRDSHRSVKWRDSIRGWKQHLRRLRRTWKPSARIVVSDWNVSYRSRWFRRFLRRTFPKMTSTWRDPLPMRGTHGRRIIDIALISGRLRLVRGPVMLRHRSSDHTAFRMVLAFRRPVR